MYVCMYIYIYINGCICICMYMCLEEWITSPLAPRLASLLWNPLSESTSACLRRSNNIYSYYIYIYIYIDTHIYIYIYLYYIYIYIYTCVCIYIYIYVYLYLSISLSLSIYIYIYIYTHKANRPASARECLLRPVHLQRVSLLRVLESNFPGDPLSNSTDMRIPTPEN